MIKQSRLNIRVYYEDTDHGGVVYHANYLRFMERGRTEMLREMGFELDRVEREFGVIFAVRRATLEFIAPARFNDYLRVETTLESLRGVRSHYQQEIYCEQALLCRGRIEVVSLDAVRFKPVALPSVLVQRVRAL